MTTATDQATAAREQLKSIYEDGFAEINERKYVFTKFNHAKRREVFAFYSTIGTKVANQDFSFLADPDFERVEALILQRVTFEDVQLSKLPEHFETYPEDYLTFICCALGVISYPFFPVSATS